ncbi:MAG: hypothetical protein GX557_04150, partial [Chloroflexi bacterium]|nr:hypothetical protein [Chloroflexota bacterium]
RILLAGRRAAWLPEVVSSYRLLHTERSLFVLAEYSRQYMLMLERLMARPDMPAAQRADYDAIKLAMRLRFAAHAYVYGQARLAQRELLQALRLAPELRRGLHPGWGEALGRAASGTWAVSSPEDYYDYVFANLPAPLTHQSGLRQQAWQLYCDLFAARRQRAEERVRRAQLDRDAVRFG